MTSPTTASPASSPSSSQSFPTRLLRAARDTRQETTYIARLLAIDPGTNQSTVPLPYLPAALGSVANYVTTLSLPPLYQQKLIAEAIYCLFNPHSSIYQRFQNIENVDDAIKVSTIELFTLLAKLKQDFDFSYDGLLKTVEEDCDATGTFFDPDLKNLLPKLANALAPFCLANQEAYVHGQRMLIALHILMPALFQKKYAVLNQWSALKKLSHTVSIFTPLPDPGLIHQLNHTNHVALTQQSLAAHSIATLQNTNKQIQQTLYQTRNAVAQAQAQIVTLTADLNNAKQTINTLTTNLAAVEIEKAALHLAYTEAKASASALAAELEALRIQTASLDNPITTTKEAASNDIDTNEANVTAPKTDLATEAKTVAPAAQPVPSTIENEPVATPATFTLQTVPASSVAPTVARITKRHPTTPIVHSNSKALAPKKMSANNVPPSVPSTTAPKPSPLAWLQSFFLRPKKETPRSLHIPLEQRITLLQNRLASEPTNQVLITELQQLQQKKQGKIDAATKKVTQEKNAKLLREGTWLLDHGLGFNRFHQTRAQHQPGALSQFKVWNLQLHDWLLLKDYNWLIQVLLFSQLYALLVVGSTASMTHLTCTVLFPSSPVVFELAISMLAHVLCTFFFGVDHLKFLEMHEKRALQYRAHIIQLKEALAAGNGEEVLVKLRELFNETVQASQRAPTNRPSAVAPQSAVKRPRSEAELHRRAKSAIEAHENKAMQLGLLCWYALLSFTRNDANRIRRVLLGLGAATALTTFSISYALLDIRPLIAFVLSMWAGNFFERVSSQAFAYFQAMPQAQQILAEAQAFYHFRQPTLNQRTAPIKETFSFFNFFMLLCLPLGAYEAYQTYLRTKALSLDNSPSANVAKENVKETPGLEVYTLGILALTTIGITGGLFLGYREQVKSRQKQDLMQKDTPSSIHTKRHCS